MRYLPSFLSVSLLLLGGQLSAQTLTSGTTEASWYAMSAVHRNLASSDAGYYNRQSHVLYLSGEEAVMPVFIDDNTTGVVKVNSRAVQQWKQEVKGIIVGLARLGENIVALYVPPTKEKYGFGEKVPTLSAVLINAASGAVRTQKLLLNLKAGNFAEVQTHKADNGELQQILVRYTQWNARIGYEAKVRKELRQTEKIERYTLGSDLTLSPPMVYTNPDKEVQYLASATAANGTMYLLWATDNSLEVEQVAKDGARTHLSTPFAWDQKPKVNTCLKINPANPQQVLAALDYQNGKHGAIKSALYSFDQKQVKTYDELLTGDYRSQLEGQVEVPESSKVKLEKSVFEQLSVVDVAFYKDQCIVVKETRGKTVSSNNVRFFNGDLLISLYDQNLSPQKNFLVNKYYEAFLEKTGRSFGYHIKDNQFQFVTNALAGPGSYMVLYGSIDLQAGKWGRLVPVKKGTSINRSTSPIEAGASAWFSSGVLVNYLKKPLLGTAISSNLQMVTVE